MKEQEETGLQKGRTDALVAPGRAPSVIARLADRFGVDQSKMLDCLKATAFKGGCTNEQLMALCIVAEQYGLNPWTREIYAFPDKNNGIVPVVGVDGWARIINSNDQFDGLHFEQDDNQCTCTIYRKDRAHPISTTEYASECKRSTQPWGSHPKRMLRHKALIQTARLAFGFVGIYDQDEAERIVAARDVKVSGAPYAKASPLEQERVADATLEQADSEPAGEEDGADVQGVM